MESLLLWACGKRSLSCTTVERGSYRRAGPRMLQLATATAVEACEQGRPSILWFNLVSTDFYSDWKGKLIVEWPPPELSWYRLAHRNAFPILAIREESALE